MNLLLLFPLFCFFCCGADCLPDLSHGFLTPFLLLAQISGFPSISEFIDLHILLDFHFSAVQDSSIGDLDKTLTQSIVSE